MLKVLLFLYVSTYAFHTLLVKHFQLLKALCNFCIILYIAYLEWERDKMLDPAKTDSYTF